jgi:hypothetical protein
MARYGTTTRLPPRQVILMAREHFGPDSRIGLPIGEESWNKVTFEGAGGAVSVTALPKAGELGATDVEIVSREYDYWAERFLGRLASANAAAPLRALRQRLARAIRRR